jgi:hypothetical protein
MKLIYRGVTYDYTSNATAPVEATRTVKHHPQLLRYRGAAYSVDPDKAAQPSFFHPIAQLMYRGVTYSTNG